MGIGELMGIEMEDNVWCQKSNSSKSSYMDNNINFLIKVKDSKNMGISNYFFFLPIFLPSSSRKYYIYRIKKKD